MNEEISESAKAIQEVAKATRTGIEATTKLGGFVARVINEPIEHVTGIISDRLRYMRWERQFRLRDRVIENIRKRGLENEFNNGQLNIVPPKLALPIIENASLEEDDELQDLWANLLTSALDPNFNGKVRAAHIDIIKQLEVIDVHLLNFIFKNYKQRLESVGRSSGDMFYTPTQFNIHRTEIMDKLKIDSNVYENSIDNLIRLRCIASFVENKTVKSVSRHAFESQRHARVSVVHGYNSVCMTSFGVNFIEACTDEGRSIDH